MDRDKIVRWPRWIVAVAALLLFLIPIAPYLVSAYYLEAGGMALDAIEHSPSKAPIAIAHLQKALEWEPGNAQAYRLLGRAYQVQEDKALGSKSQRLMVAIEALIHYTELRPDNPLGHIELAQLYEAIEAEMQTMQRIDLLAALPQAAVEAPDVPADTPYARPDGPAWHSYVAETTFSLSPNFGRRSTLFVHPPSRVIYQLTLPVEPCLLRFGMSLAPEAINWMGDGVTFEVLIDGDSVFQEYLGKQHALQGWQERTVDLLPWAGQTIALSLGVGPGPAGDVAGDWAGWGEPQIVDAWLPTLEVLRPGEQMLAEWQRAGLTVNDFIEQGENTRQAKLYDKALTWYERAMRLEPARGDLWYYIGQIYEDMEEWSAALDAYGQATKLKYFHQIGRSDPHYRTGIIYQKKLNPRQLEKALAAYEAALAMSDFGSTGKAADCHYRRGQILREQKADPNEYIAEFERALELDANHPWAHMRLGLAYYDRNQDLEAAESELLQAFDLAPNSKWPRYYLAKVYHHAGRKDDAVMMYELTLELDPDFEAAQKRLAELEKE